MKLKKTELLYYAEIILLTIYNSLRMTKVYSENFDVLLYASVFFLFLKIMMEKHSIKELFVFFILSGLGIFSIKYSNNGTLLICIVAILGCQGIKIERVLKVLCITQCIVYMIVIMGALFGFVDNIVMQSVRNGNTVVRYAYGFAHPNQLACSLILFLILFQYLYKIPQIAFLGIYVFLDIVIYKITASRTSFVIFTLFIIGKYLLNIFAIKKIIYYVALSSYSFLMFLSVFIPRHLSNGWCRMLDIALQYRMTLSNQFLARFPINLFGTKIDSSGMSNYHVLDSGYINVLLTFGIAVWGAFVIINIYLIYIYNKQQKYEEMLIIIVISLLGFTENVLYSLIYNFTLLWAGEVLLNGRGKKKNAK